MLIGADVTGEEKGRGGQGRDPRVVKAVEVLRQQFANLLHGRAQPPRPIVGAQSGGAIIVGAVDVRGVHERGNQVQLLPRLGGRAAGALVVDRALELDDSIRQFRIRRGGRHVERFGWASLARQIQLVIQKLSPGPNEVRQPLRTRLRVALRADRVADLARVRAKGPRGRRRTVGVGRRC